jgi:hypothetical protein
MPAPSHNYIKGTLSDNLTPFSHSIELTPSLSLPRCFPAPDRVLLIIEEMEMSRSPPREEPGPEEPWSFSPSTPKLKEEAPPLHTPSHRPLPPFGARGENPILHRLCRAKPQGKRTIGASFRLHSGEPPMAPSRTTRRLAPSAITSCWSSIQSCAAKIRRGRIPSVS